jgi:FMN phosphatase YigB (HAD superfamily)
MITKNLPKRKKRTVAKPPPNPKIRCVIFDLDDTLYDCLGQRVRVAHRHAAEATAKAGLNASVLDIYRVRMRAFRHDPMLRYIDSEVARHFNVEDPETLSTVAREAYFNCPVGRLRLFPGALPLLRFLAKRGVRNFIVSFGEPKIQQAKVEALGLDREPSIENIYYADRGNVLTKEEAFRQIKKKTRLDASQILIVGDRPMREIRAGKALGMRTVRLHHGEFKNQQPVGPEEEPDYKIRNIADVKKLPFVWGNEAALKSKNE